MKPTKQLMDYVLNSEAFSHDLIGYDKARKLFSDFTDEMYEDFRYILDKEKEISETEWENFFEKYKHNASSPILQALMESDYITDKLRNKMVDYLVNGDYEERLSINDQRDHTLMRALTKSNISQKNVLAIIKYMHKREVDFVSFIYNFGHKINDECLKMITNEYLSMKTEMRKSNCEGVLKGCLLQIRDEKYIRQILEKFPLEKYRNVLISNQNLSDEFRKEIYDMGVNIEKIDFKNLSKDVFDDAYACVSDAFFELDVNAKNFDIKKGLYTSKDDKENITAFTKAKNVLWYIIPELSQAQQYDLFLRLKTFNLSKENETMFRILSSTSNEQILREAIELKSIVHQEQAYSNKYMPKDLIDKRLKEIAEKSLRAYQKNGSVKMSKRDAKFIIGLMTDKDYEIDDNLLCIAEKVVDNTEKELLVTNRKTPDKVLDVIINNAKTTPISSILDANLYILAQLNKSVDRKYKDKSFSDVLNLLFSYYDGYRSKENAISNIMYLYNKNSDVKPFIEETLKEIRNLSKSKESIMESMYIKPQIREMDRILTQAIKNIKAIENSSVKASKELLIDSLRQELFPFCSLKYSVLDFYMEAEKKIENISKIINDFDCLKKEEIMQDKCEKCR